LGIKVKESSSGANFTAIERAYLAENSSFNLCVDPDWMPLEGIDERGQHVGISAEILAVLSQNSGIKLNLVPTDSWPQTLELAEARECDLISLAMRTPSRDRT